MIEIQEKNSLLMHFRTDKRNPKLRATWLSSLLTTQLASRPPCLRSSCSRLRVFGLCAIVVASSCGHLVITFATCMCSYLPAPGHTLLTPSQYAGNTKGFFFWNIPINLIRSPSKSTMQFSTRIIWSGFSWYYIFLVHCIMARPQDQLRLPCSPVIP